MSFLTKNRTFFTLTILVLVIISASAAIFYARGFKPDFRNLSIERTGLIVVASVPTGAQVYLDDRLVSATDTNIAYLEPKTYKVRIEKDGYTTWEKEITVLEDLATEITALLFPLAPEIKPLTATGSINPSLSPDGGKIAYGVPGERGGLYILPMSDGPLAFRQNPKQVATNTAAVDFTRAKFIWGPDSQDLIARFEENGQVTANILIDTNESQNQIRDITASLSATISGWQQEIDTRAQTLAVIVPQEVKDATSEAKPATGSPTPTPRGQTAVTSETVDNELINYYPTGLLFSPDEEKVLYQDKDGRYKVYDLKLKKEYTLPNVSDILKITWFADSNHLVIAQKDQISIIESDGANKMTVFSGKFENGFVFSHPSGQRLIILTTLTQSDGTRPNLYSINLK